MWTSNLSNLESTFPPDDEMNINLLRQYEHSKNNTSFTEQLRLTHRPVCTMPKELRSVYGSKVSFFSWVFELEWNIVILSLGVFNFLSLYGMFFFVGKYYSANKSKILNFLLVLKGYILEVRNIRSFTDFETQINSVL